MLLQQIVLTSMANRGTGSSESSFPLEIYGVCKKDVAEQFTNYTVPGCAYIATPGESYYNKCNAYFRCSG